MMRIFKKTRLLKKLSRDFATFFFLFALFSAPAAHAGLPNYFHAFDIYLKDGNGDPITAQQTVRFSLWSDFIVKSGDIDVNGEINASAPNYASYQIAQTVSPDTDGEVGISLDGLDGFPSAITIANCFLQIEYKPIGAPDTSYLMYDPTLNTADIVDRKLLLPFDISSFTMDAGSQTTSNIFVLDRDSTGGDVSLQFGATLAEYLKWESTGSYFHLSDDLRVGGTLMADGTNLTLDYDNTGSGADIKIIAKQGSDSDGELKYNATGNRWELRNDGGDYIPLVGTSLTQTLTGKTIDGDDNTLSDIDFSSLKTRVIEKDFVPVYSGAVFFADGSNNSGTMNTGYDASNLHNYYVWSTTEGTLQDYDIVLRWMIPRDFVSFDETAPLKISLKTTTASSAENKIDVTMKDTDGSAVTITNASGLVSASGNTWREVGNIGISGTPDFTSGGYVTVFLKMSATTGNNAYLGEISFKYNGK